MDFKLGYNNFNVREENKLIIIISLLHLNGFISHKSLVALFKKAREGKLYRRVNTYRSNVNKKWYSDESTYEIYLDIFETKMNPKDKLERLKLERINKLRKLDGLEETKFKTYLDFEETIKYLNLYLNKPRNYCIDHLFYEYIKPCVNSYSYSTELLNMFNCDFSNLEYSYSIHDNYYCCEYCCGDYNDWLESQEYYKKEELKKLIFKEISDFLNKKRKQYKGCNKELK